MIFVALGTVEPVLGDICSIRRISKLLGIFHPKAKEDALSSTTSQYCESVTSGEKKRRSLFRRDLSTRSSNRERAYFRMALEATRIEIAVCEEAMVRVLGLLSTLWLLHY